MDLKEAVDKIVHIVHLKKIELARIGM